MINPHCANLTQKTVLLTKVILRGWRETYKWSTNSHRKFEVTHTDIKNIKF